MLVVKRRDVDQEVTLDRKQKEQQVEYIINRFEKAKSLIFADYRGLNVSEITELRSKLSESNSEMKVVKNRLTKRAVKALSIDGLDDYLVGPTAMASSDEDPVMPAKVLVDFAKNHEVLEIKAGYMDGKVLDVGIIRRLASLPSKEVLLSRALSSMQAPATNFVMVLSAISRNLVNVINAIKDKKEQ